MILKTFLNNKKLFLILYIMDKNICFKKKYYKYKNLYCLLKNKIKEGGMTLTFNSPLLLSASEISEYRIHQGKSELEAYKDYYFSVISPSSIGGNYELLITKNEEPIPSNKLNIVLSLSASEISEYRIHQGKSKWEVYKDYNFEVEKISDGYNLTITKNKL